VSDPLAGGLGAALELAGGSEHRLDAIAYRVRVEVVAEIVDKRTGEVVVTGGEAEVKQLYRTLKRRAA
jgi:hypothetical protein